MLLYSIIMFVAGLLFVGLSIAIYKGKTNLIHDYHQTNVTDKAAYGKAFGKAMLVIAIAMLFSGIVSLLDDSEITAIIAVAVLIIGLIIGFVCFAAVQKKYNNGVF